MTSPEQRPPGSEPCPDPGDHDSGRPTHRLRVDADRAGVRLDRFLADAELPFTRSQLKRQIDDGACRVNGEVVRPSRKLRAGDEVLLSPPPPEPSRAIPEDLPLAVLFEDEHLVVVDKAPGMVVHPAAGHGRGTLVNAVLGRCGALADVGDPLRPGIVHRLDKLTSGVMVVTKTDAARLSLSEQFAVHSVERRYLVLVSGEVQPSRGTFRTLHGRHPRDRKRFSSRVSRGRDAVTHYRVLERLAGATLLEARLETGRTHQVRVHFADAGWPVVGDPAYGRPPAERRVRGVWRALGRQALHARVLGFDHPQTGERLRFETPPPGDMARALAELGSSWRTESHGGEEESSG